MAVFKYEKLISRSPFCKLVFISPEKNDHSTEAAPTEIVRLIFTSLFKLGHIARSVELVDTSFSCLF